MSTATLVGIKSGKMMQTNLAGFFKILFIIGGPFDYADIDRYDFIVRPDESEEFVAGVILPGGAVYYVHWGIDQALRSGELLHPSFKISDPEDAQRCSTMVAEAVVLHARGDNSPPTVVTQSIYDGPTDATFSRSKHQDLVRANNDHIYEQVLDVLRWPGVAELLKTTSLRLSHINLILRPPTGPQGETQDTVKYARMYPAVVGQVVDLIGFAATWDRSSNFDTAIKEHFALGPEAARVLKLVPSTSYTRRNPMWFSAVVCAFGKTSEELLATIRSPDEALRLWSISAGIISSAVFESFPEELFYADTGHGEGNRFNIGAVAAALVPDRKSYDLCAAFDWEAFVGYIGDGFDLANSMGALLLDKFVQPFLPEWIVDRWRKRYERTATPRLRALALTNLCLWAGLPEVLGVISSMEPPRGCHADSSIPPPTAEIRLQALLQSAFPEKPDSERAWMMVADSPTLILAGLASR